MSVHPLSSPRAIDPVAQAKAHLAAAHRLAVLHELEEGIDNHFTVLLNLYAVPFDHLANDFGVQFPLLEHFSQRLKILGQTDQKHALLRLRK